MGFFSELKEDLAQAVNELVSEDEVNLENPIQEDITAEDPIPAQEESSKAEERNSLPETAEELGRLIDSMELDIETEFAPEEVENEAKEEELAIEDAPGEELVKEEELAAENEPGELLAEDELEELLPEEELTIEELVEEEPIPEEAPEELLPEEELTIEEVLEEKQIPEEEPEELLPEEEPEELLPEEEVIPEDELEELSLEEEPAMEDELAAEEQQEEVTEEIIIEKQEEMKMQEEEQVEEMQYNDGMEVMEVENPGVEGEAIDETALITAGMTVKGDITSQGSLNVIGTVEGNIDILGKLNITGNIEGSSKAADVYAEKARINGDIHSNGSIKIGQSTIVIGNIFASSAVIAGAVKGDIDVKGPVILDTSAIVMGNIKSKSVQINNGAVIEGLCSQCYADVNPSSFFEDLKKARA